MRILFGISIVVGVLNVSAVVPIRSEGGLRLALRKLEDRNP